jgi:phosphoribosylamine--glycine ligase
MRVLVLGDDGRAHALVWKLFNSPHDIDLLCAPGNGGTGLLAPLVGNLDVRNAAEVGRWAFDEGVDLIVPASGAPLRAGVVDEVVSFQIGVCGPSQRSTVLETSRCRAKEFMLRYELPTVPGRAFDNLATAEKYLAAHSLPVAVWADSPEVGGAVFADRYQALAALRTLFATRPLDSANDGVVIEEHVPGFPVSLSCFTDGTTAVPLLPVRTYETLGPGDEGPPAPGMGAFTDVSLYSERLTSYLHRRLLAPLVAGLAREGLPFWGILGIDCTVGQDGPRLTSIRCALRDLEAQVLLPRLEDDLLPLIQLAITRRLHDLPPLRWKPQASLGIGAVAQGYPNHFGVGMRIEGFAKLEPGVLVFHSHTDNSDARPYEQEPLAQRGGGLVGLLSRAQLRSPGSITSTDGHVLTLVALGSTLAEARATAYRNAEHLEFAGRFYRPDIGARSFS